MTGTLTPLPSKKQFRTALAGVLRSVRDTTTLSQEGLAQAAAIDRTSISLYERGERIPNTWNLVKLAHAMDTDAPLMLTLTLARLRGEHG